MAYHRMMPRRIHLAHMRREFYHVTPNALIHPFFRQPATMKFLTLLLVLPVSTWGLAVPDIANRAQDISDKARKKYYGGAGVGRLILDESVATEGAVVCHYDMVLCERIQGRPKTESGLFVPDKDLPRLHLCKGELDRSEVPLDGTKINP
jgi:hypothetical protein